MWQFYQISFLIIFDHKCNINIKSTYANYSEIICGYLSLSVCVLQHFTYLFTTFTVLTVVNKTTKKLINIILNLITSASCNGLGSCASRGSCGIRLKGNQDVVFWRKSLFSKLIKDVSKRLLISGKGEHVFVWI